MLPPPYPREPHRPLSVFGLDFRVIWSCPPTKIPGRALAAAETQPRTEGERISGICARLSATPAFIVRRCPLVLLLYILKISKYRFDIDISYRIVSPAEMSKFSIYRYQIFDLSSCRIFIYSFIQSRLKKVQQQTNNEENPNTYLCIQ